MAKCYQCDRPAMYLVDDQNKKSIPLCLHCYEKFAHIHQIAVLQSAALLNHALDDMDMISGIPGSGGRLPVAEMARAMQKASTYNNIQISNSQVGVVSTGELARIDAAITLTKGSDVDVVGRHLQTLTQAVIDDASLKAQDRKEVIDLLQSLADQIVSTRKPAVISALAHSIRERLSEVVAFAPLAYNLFEAIKQVIGG